MNTNNLLKSLSWVNNRGSGQVSLLFELCGNDFEKLMYLLAVMKKYAVFGCPDNEQEVNDLLKKSLD